MDGWTDGWMDAWMHGCMHGCRYTRVRVCKCLNMFIVLDICTSSKHANIPVKLARCFCCFALLLHDRSSQFCEYDTSSSCGCSKPCVLHGDVPGRVQ